MSDETRLDRSRQWFDAAFDELKAAKTLLDAGSYAQSCFYAQQSVEKAMKGVMAADGKAITTHSIAKLMINLPQDNQLDDLEPIRLDKFYILTRYPESLPEGASIRQIFGRRDAEDGYATASGTVHLLAGWAKELGVTIPELNKGILPRK